MEFEYDPRKSEATRVKHGIDFEKAQQLWEDDDLIELPSKQEKPEIRYLTVGLIRGKLWTAISTLRGEKTRIISVRHSQKDGEELYYES